MAEPTNFYPLFALMKTLLFPIIKLVTDFIKEALEGAIQDLYKKAKTTDSPWDDFFIERLAFLLSIDLSEVE